MNKEIIESWRLVKESNPNAVLFVRFRDIYYLMGSDVDKVKFELGIRCFGTTVGFPSNEAWYYMRQLAKKPLPVLRVESSGVWPVSPNGIGPEPKRPRGTFIALDPRLLFDADDLARLRLEDHLYMALVDPVKRHDYKALREYGELYVFEVFGGYDIDWELTTMLPSRAVHLARAALETGSKLPCRLVPPKAWRGRRKKKRDPQPPQPPKNFGQMRLEF
jgi:hypothetical protein